MQERVAKLEAQMENVLPLLQRVDARLHRLEILAATGLGALGLLQFILSKWS